MNGLWTIGAVVWNAAGLSNQQSSPQNPTLRDFKESQSRSLSTQDRQSSQTDPRNEYRRSTKNGDTQDPVMRIAVGEAVEFKNAPNPARFSPPLNIDFSSDSRAKDVYRDPYQHKSKGKDDISEKAVHYLQRQREASNNLPFPYRDYHYSEGSIPRERFQEVQEQHNLSNRAARSQILDSMAAKAEADARMEAQKKEIISLKRYLRVMRSALADAGGVPAILGEYSVHQVQELLNPKTSEIVRPATWGPEDFAESSAPIGPEVAGTWRRADHSRKRECLRDDIYGQVLELRAEILLCKAKIAMISEEWTKMQSYISDAGHVAEQLCYLPFNAVIDFYLAIAKYNLGHIKEAWRHLNLAKMTRGHYREGYLISGWEKKIGKLLQSVDPCLSKEEGGEGCLTLRI